MPVFDLTTPEQLLDKLKSEQRRLLTQPYDSCTGFNAAVTAYHLAEWVWNQRQPRDYPNLDRFKEMVQRECPSGWIVRDIANSAKHFTLRDAPPNSSRGQGGGFSNAFSSGFEINHLVIDTSEGPIRFNQVLGDVVAFWDEFLCEHPSQGPMTATESP